MEDRGNHQGLPSHCYKSFTRPFSDFSLPGSNHTPKDSLCFHFSASLDLQLDGWVPMQWFTAVGEGACGTCFVHERPSGKLDCWTSRITTEATLSGTRLAPQLHLPSAQPLPYKLGVTVLQDLFSLCPFKTLLPWGLSASWSPINPICNLWQCHKIVLKCVFLSRSFHRI